MHIHECLVEKYLPPVEDMEYTVDDVPEVTDYMVNMIVCELYSSFSGNNVYGDEDEMDFFEKFVDKYIDPVYLEYLSCEKKDILTGIFQTWKSRIYHNLADMNIPDLRIVVGVNTSYIEFNEHETVVGFGSHVPNEFVSHIINYVYMRGIDVFEELGITPIEVRVYRLLDAQ